MEYREYKLKEIMYNFKYGTMPKKEKIKSFEEGKYPIYTGYLISGYYDECNIENETLIVVARGVGGTGDVKLTTKKCFLTNLSIAMFNDEKIVSNKYLYYYFKIHNLRYLDSGSAQSQITINDLKNVKVPVPKRDIQDKIVKILSQLDIKIKLNNQINDNLYKIIKTQYDKFINNIDEYELVKLKDIANIGSGKRPKIKGNDFNIPLIGASGVMAYTDNYNFNEDILIIGRVGTLGVVQRYFDKIWASDNTLTIKTEFSSAVECYLKTVDYISLNRGSTQPLITQTDISNLELKFNKLKFGEFENQIRPLRDKIYKNELQNETLEQLRDTLLPKLMNGEIDLDKIEI